MKQRLSPKLFTLIFGFLLLFNSAKASHDKGGFISYTYVSGNTYHVTFTLFRDCSGISAPGSVSINYASTTCALTGSAIANLTSSQNSTNICPSLSLQTTCNGGAYVGEEMYVYETDITLPSNCTDWVLSYQDCCVSGSITNVDPSSGMYFSATLDNLNYPNNSSPILTSPSIGVVCAGIASTYNFGAVDIDGDSLAFELTSGMNSAGVPMSYVGGFTPLYPLSSSPALTVDPVTGNIDFFPNAIQMAVIAINISEYRNGVLISSAVRQFIVTTTPCTNNQPVVSNITNISGGTLTAPNEITVCPNTTISFDITANDLDAAQLLTMTSVSAFPGAVFTQTGTNPVTGTYTWTPTYGFTGTNVVLLTVADDNCPYLGRQFKAIKVVVRQTTFAGADLNYCSAQGPLSLSVVGGANFTWSVLSGDPVMSCTNCQNPEVSPTTTTVYRVQSDLVTCNNADTVVVNVVPNFSFLLDETTDICTPYYATANLNLDIVPTPAGTYTFQWSDLGSSWTGNTSSVTIPVTVDTDVKLTISSSAGCVLSDTISINSVVYDLNPNWAITTSTLVCDPNPIDLVADVNYGAQCDQYNITNIPFQPEIGTGTPVSLSDDQLSTILPIGFDFNFYCTNYSDFYISSNGFISFTPEPNGCCSGQNIPNTAQSNNLIALAWSDLNPGTGGTIEYFMNGVAPFRKLVVNFNNVPFFGSATPGVSSQIILYETTNVIEMHITSINGPTNTVTIGIENQDGTMAVPVPGYLATSVVASNEAWRFYTNANEPYLLTWQEPLGTDIGTGNPLSVTPSSLTTYYAVLTDPTGLCVSGTQSVTIDVDMISPAPDASTLSDITSACAISSILAPTATDNCAGVIDGVTTTAFPITNTTTIVWEYTDGMGNMVSQSQNIIVSDNAAPIADIPVLSDVLSECEITSLTTPTASDNCGNVVVTNDAILPISLQGTTIINWTYTDDSGNSSSQAQNIIISDQTAPNAPMLSDFDGNCDAVLPIPTTTDNCSGTLIGTTNDPLVYSNPGVYIVNWDFEDNAGNITSVAQNVVVTSTISYATLTVSECETYTAPSGAVLTTTGTFTDVITNVSGCDSIITINLTINTVDVAVNQSGITLTANTSGAQYTWIDCSDNSEIIGEVNQSFTPTVNGSYAVVVYENQCSDTSNCIQINSVDLMNLNGDDEISIYPNPSLGHFNIQGENLAGVKATVVDVNGRVILERNLQDTETVLDLNSVESGMYILHIRNSSYRLIRQ